MAISKNIKDGLLYVEEPLKNLELYREGNNYYLRATYEVERDDGIYEMIIPKIDLNINASVTPDINTYIDNGSPWSFPRKTCTVRFDNVTCHKYNLKEDDIGLPYNQKVFYTEKLIKSKVKEMTIEEIEKKLGHPVKIVKSK